MKKLSPKLKTTPKDLSYRFFQISMGDLILISHFINKVINENPNDYYTKIMGNQILDNLLIQLSKDDVEELLK